MKKIVFIILILVGFIYLIGCGKKQQSLQELQEPISMEELTKVGVVQSTPQAPAQLEPLPPAGPYKPKAREIQTALKNAGYYVGEIDGKIGPLTKKAIEEFQKANGLEVDGKVGPKTWAALSPYLNPPVESQPKKKQ